MTNNDEVLHQVLSHFQDVSHAFGYGSGVVRQAGYKTGEKPMMDFIFAVSDVSTWHRRNREKNPSHYATIPRFLLNSDGGSKIVEAVQNMGAGIYYNTEIPIEGNIVKYGVISTDKLCQDLIEWDTLYVSGRMQKPVVTVQSNPRVVEVNAINLASALRSSLLLLPEAFSEEELYTKITSLSYAGDIRMRFAENPQKITNIVRTNMDRFRDLYHPIITSQFHRHLMRDHQQFKQDKSPDVRLMHMTHLPEGLRYHMTKTREQKQQRQTFEMILKQKTETSAVSNGLASIVKSSSTTQTAK
ncbi:hypothetical protein PROFUN_16102, partial [Planoprotostelium fungivorum]